MCHMRSAPCLLRCKKKKQKRRNKVISIAEIEESDFQVPTSDRNGGGSSSERPEFSRAGRKKTHGTLTSIHVQVGPGSMATWDTGICCMTRHEPIGAKHVEKAKNSHLFFSYRCIWVRTYPFVGVAAAAQPSCHSLAAYDLEREKKNTQNLD